jgi:probable F420-dependent oxidoreductase
MDIGIALPHHGRYATPENISRVAREAEQIGYASLWVLERLIRPTHPLPGPSGRPNMMPESYANVYEPIETLTYAAAQTSRIKLGTSVMDVFFHVPVVLARRLATLDQLSGGRVIAGLGQGSNPEEFATANLSIKRRGNGFEEYLAAVRAVWGPDPVSFSGRFYQIAESQVGPKPVQKGGPPIFIGANAPAAIERAGRIADGFNPTSTLDWATFEQNLNRFRSAAKAAGRNPNELPIIVRSNTLMSDKVTPETKLLNGTVEKVREDLARMESLKINEVFFDFNSGQMPVDDQLRLIERLRKRLP